MTHAGSYHDRHPSTREVRLASVPLGVRVPSTPSTTHDALALTIIHPHIALWVCDPSRCAVSVLGSVWFRWTTPSAGIFTIGTVSTVTPTPVVYSLYLQRPYVDGNNHSLADQHSVHTSFRVAYSADSSQTGEVRVAPS